jgi:photosystem II stability/assembly factor-like uncharacterized protein
MIKIILILLFIHCSLLIAQAQWILQPSGVTSPLYDIEMINRSTGWICGEGSKILKTTNGGMNWISQVTISQNKPLLDIHPVNDSVVYSVGWFGTILKTTNGGDNWIAIQNGTGNDGNYFCVFFLNENTGWISENIMSHGEIKKTTDGGMTFNSSLTFGWPNDLYFKDSLNGIGVSGAATIHKTTNGGNNWQSFQIAGEGDFYRVSFIDNYTGYAVANGTNKVYKTIDFGTSWNEIAIVQDVAEALYSITFSSDSIGWIGGNFGRFYKTTNGGLNWRRENLFAGYLFSISTVNDSVVWTCGNGGRIWHTSNGGEPLVGIENVSTKIPETFLLKQNYPNPFNSETNIEFDIKISGKYKLEIFNSLSRIEEVLFNEEFKSGSYRYRFNSDLLSSGVYIYRLSSTQQIETKKFILIK